MLLHVAVAYPFQLPSRILLDGYNTVCYLYLLKDILVVASCVWFLTLSKMFSSFPQVVACNKLHCSDIPHLFIHPSGDGHLGCFHCLATMTNAAVSIYVQVFE